MATTLGYAGPMTDDEWNSAMLAKLDAWLADSPYKRRTLLDHMGMSAETFIQWRETGRVAKETRIFWVVFDDEICRRVWGDLSV